MIDITGLREDKRPQSSAIVHALLDRLDAAEKSDAESLAMYRKARDERDALRAALRHEADCVEAAKAEIEALRAKIEATEQQEPARLVTATAYRWRYRGAVMWQYGELTEETARRAKEHNHEVQPLYALPGAHPAPSVPDGWLRAIDEALVVAHLGVAEAEDGYEEARRKLNELICWHVTVATDPAVNGGWKLVPIEPTKEMRAAWDSSPICEDDDAEFRRAYSEMLAAAPGSSRDDQHAGGLKALNHQGLMERARQNAKKEAGLIYPDDDARREEKEQELASEYYRQYTTPNPWAKPSSTGGQAMTDHANELRRYSRKIGHPAGDVPSVMLAAADEIERLAARLEAAEKERDDVAQQLVQSEVGKREISEAHDALQVEVGKLKDLEVSRCVKINGYIVDNARLAEEVVRLQAKIAEMEKQEPVAEWIENRFHQYPQLVWNEKYRVDIGDKLYALPGAKGEKK